MYDFELTHLPHTRGYYHGIRRDNICTAIVLCCSEEHARIVSEAFPIPGALYIPIYANVTGIRTERIILFRSGFGHQARENAQQQLNNIRMRLLPNRQHEVYYV